MSLAFYLVKKHDEEWWGSIAVYCRTMHESVTALDDLRQRSLKWEPLRNDTCIQICHKKTQKTQGKVVRFDACHFWKVSKKVANGKLESCQV